MAENLSWFVCGIMATISIAIFSLAISGHLHVFGQGATGLGRLFCVW